MPGCRELDADVLEPDAGGVRHRPHGQQRVRPGDLAAVLEPDEHAVGGALDGRHPRPAEHLHPALGEDVLDDLGGIGVLAGEHPVAGGDEHDLRAQPEVGLGQLGAGDARPHHDEPFGQGVEVVDLLPGEDALAVGARRVHDPRAGTGGDEHHVGLEVEHAVGGLGAHRRGGGQHGPAGEHPHPDLGQAGGDVVALRGGQVEHPRVDLAQVGHGIRDLVALGVLEVHPELVGGLEVAHVVGRGDQRLARHAVGEHRRTAEAVALDDGDLGTEVRGDEGGLVPTGPPTEDDDSARPRAHVVHPTTAPQVAGADVGHPTGPGADRHDRPGEREGGVRPTVAGAPVTFEFRLAEHTRLLFPPHPTVPRVRKGLQPRGSRHLPSMTRRSR